MGIKKTCQSNDEELAELMGVLKRKPELRQRLLSIAKLADEPTQTGRIRSADEVEMLLIEEVRRLGNEALAGWAQGVDLVLGQKLKAENPGVKMREKKR